ncbi:MAG: hypothetical protein KZQ58_01400 [gamma proteobacterium symbiont of Bathyaustriella thionipta]|nr:hypothetical protein [gamma proteobacterium symbiont of Bathyaustriella thionipta]
MNPWKLNKVAPLRAALIALQSMGSLDELVIDQLDQNNTQALWLSHRQYPALNAYLFTYGQLQDRYGLQLGYPNNDAALQAAYGVLENLTLERLAEHLQMHFAL